MDKKKKPTTKVGLLDQLKPDDRRRFLKSLRGKGDIQVRQYGNWIRDFLLVSEALAREGYQHRPELISVFWLRVYGVVTEVISNLKPQPFLQGHEHSLDAAMQRHLLYRQAAYDAALEVRTCFTDDELIFLDLQRQTNAHVLQRGYELGIKNEKGAVFLKDTYFVKPLGREVLIDETDAAFLRVFISYGRNERQAARAMAAKVTGPAAKLLHTYQAMARS